MLGNNIPTKRNTTYTPDEVARKSSEELYEISFNKDQKAALEAKFSSGGGSASPLVVNISNNTLDKTWQEIYDAFPNVYVLTTADDGSTKLPIIRIIHNSTGYFLDITNFSTGRSDIYWTADPSGYPMLD